MVGPRRPNMAGSGPVLPVGEAMSLGTGALEGGVQRLNQQTGFIFVWGRFTYDDGFGVSRWLTFCHRYNCGPERASGGRIDAKHARQHYRYNDAD